MGLFHLQVSPKMTLRRLCDDFLDDFFELCDLFGLLTGHRHELPFRRDGVGHVRSVFVAAEALFHVGDGARRHFVGLEKLGLGFKREIIDSYLPISQVLRAGMNFPKAIPGFQSLFQN